MPSPATGHPDPPVANSGIGSTKNRQVIMRSINPGDAAAVRSAFNRDGQTGALFEIMHRWPGMTEEKAKDLVDGILAMSMEEHHHPGSTAIVRDLTTGRKSRRW